MKNEFINELNIIHNELKTGRSSCWSHGIEQYYNELIEELAETVEWYGREPENINELKSWCLNGARDWKQYSYGGCSLCYDGDIANRLCTPTELKRTKHGELKPNANESWLDTQARALAQAWYKIGSAYAVYDLRKKSLMD